MRAPRAALAAHSHAQPAAASPRRHPRCRRLPRRPRPLPKRAPSQRESPVGSEHYVGACLPALVSGSRLGIACPAPCTPRCSTPPAPAGRAEPQRAGSAHVRGCLAAPGSPVAEAPPELRALETPCSFGLLPSSSPASPPGPGGRPPRPPPPPLRLSARWEPVFRARLGSPRRASPRVGEPPPPLRRLANNQAPLVSRQRNLRNAWARAHSHSRAHTQAHAGGELELGRRSSFLSYPKKLPTLTLANCCSSVLDYSPRRRPPLLN